MKRYLAVIIILGFLLVGCDSLRFAPGEAQKQNAWLHNRTAQMTADMARTQNTSKELRGLTSLCALQSRAFVSYYGIPKEFPQAQTTEDILAESNWQIARTALTESNQRPDVWQLADGALELAIGVAALFGGVYGTRVVRFLKQTRTKSNALREIIAGNELFKRQYPASESAFKDAHRDQSTQTRQIVTQVKSGT